MKRSFTVFLSGELFDLKHLIGNAYVAEAIYERSHGRYLCVLPQDFEPRGRTTRTLRDRNLRALAASDLAVFLFDGKDLESGAVTEFMMAKFADIPAVVIRSDRQAAGDHASPWNLMAGRFPRTVVLGVDGFALYQAKVRRRRTKLSDVLKLAGQHGSADAQRLCDDVAGSIVRALDRVRVMEPAMPRHLREEVYHWLAIMPGLRGRPKDLRREFESCLEAKVQRDLL